MGRVCRNVFLQQCNAVLAVYSIFDWGIHDRSGICKGYSEKPAGDTGQMAGCDKSESGSLVFADDQSCAV